MFQALALALARRGNAVRVLTSHTHGGAIGNDSAYGFPVLRISQFKHFTPQYRTYMPPVPLAMRGVRAFLEGSDVYHMHGYGMPFIDVVFNFCVLARKVVFTTHGFPYTAPADSGALGAAYRLYDRVFGSRILRKSARLTAVSSPVASQTQMVCGREVVTIPNGFVPVEPMGEIDPSIACELAKGAYLLGVGRLEELKGFDRSIRALALLRDRGFVLRLVLAGRDTGRERSLRALAEDLGLSDAVSFLGEIPREQLAHCYSGASCVVVSSAFESFGLVTLEAMSRGVPVVASAVGGIPDVVKDAENGLLFPPGDVEAMVACIERVLSQPALRESLVRAGQATLTHFQWGEIAARYEAVYASCV